jgi:FkbM family methyltransferase
MGEAALALTGFRRERGLLWPDYDRRCAEVTFSEVGDLLPAVMPLVPQRRVAVQAGGNCGQLVSQLSEEFGSVYTFEPDPENFVALTVNTALMRGVFRYQAALGAERALRGLATGDRHFPSTNCGALYMSGAGPIPTLAIDDLGLTVCDLIMLDIEGGEFSALRSAQQTIDRCRPVVVIEDKGLGTRFYGEPLHAAQTWLIKHYGYSLVTRVKNDTVLMP